MSQRPQVAAVSAAGAGRRLLLLMLLMLLCALALHAASLHARAAASGDVLLLNIDGVITRLTADYLIQGLQEGTATQAGAVVVRLNTPGGLGSAMREMTQAMLAAPLPVVVYVGPSGARAASAGMFLTLAAHVAAMAPGTHIGAAHPVGIGGQADPALADELVDDAAAAARAIAAARGRNAAWAEQAVRESGSLTAEEALALGVIDSIANDQQELLRQLDGRPVVTATGPVTLRTAEARVVELPMSLPARALQLLADPNIAYLLFILGVIGIIAELYSPGTLFPGIVGAIALVLAFVGFGTLPVNWAGVLLLLLALGLFVAELVAEGFGLLAVGGLIAFVLASLILFSPVAPTSPAMPSVGVSPWLIGGMAAGIAAFFLLVGRAALESTRAPVATGAEALRGRVGVAVSDLAPSGTARVDGELWNAVAEEAPIRAGEEVQIVGVDGIRLQVRRRG